MSLTKVTYSMVSGAVANVLDFGADNTGSTDSSSAFTAAVATGKTVFVPKGTYKASFDLGNNQIIFGEGAKNQSIIKPPAGAAHAIRVNATSSAKQHCQIYDLMLSNIDSVASCKGILFQGTDVNTINDWHEVANVYITGFDLGIAVVGRQIWSKYSMVEIVNCRRSLQVNTDVATPAFNNNTFTNCRFAQNTENGVVITGQNSTNAFYSCNFELCNSLNSAGVAAVSIDDTEEVSFIGCYWEANGTGVAVDTVTLFNNSIGVKFGGSYCYNPKIEQAYFVGSGVLVWVSTSVRGGVLENSRLNPLATGYSLYVSSSLSAINAPQFIYDSSNFNNGKILITQDANGNYAGRVNQITSCYYMTSKETVDLTQTGKLVVAPNGTTFTGIDAITNMIPGLEFWVWNESGANSFTIDAALIYRGSGVIALRTSRKYMVGGFPADGKLIEM